jgi:nucleoside-diphosphate-sugar epimerase
MTAFTVLGAGGFIGGALASYLAARGHQVTALGRDELNRPPPDLGHAVYAIGLTADFRSRPHETVEAHVALLSRLLRTCRFDSFLYLSSTRVYAGAAVGDEEASLAVTPADPDQLYNASKIMGEALCLADPRAGCRVARLSNVVGSADRSDNFLSSVVREARSRCAVTFRTAPTSARDYVFIDDVCRTLTAIATAGRHRLYNVASGRNTANQEIADLLHKLAGVACDFAAGAPRIHYPEVSIARLKTEFSHEPVPFEHALRALLTPTKKVLCP